MKSSASIRARLARVVLMGYALWSLPAAVGHAQGVGSAVSPAVSLDTRVPAARIVSDGARGAIVTWHDYRSGYSNIYAQRISVGGSVQWTANGVALCTATREQESPRIASDGRGGAIVTWQDNRSDDGSRSNADIYAQLISAGGTVQWTANGVALCTATGNQYYPAVVADGAGGAIVAWQDSRSGANSWNLYTQHSPFTIVTSPGPDGSIEPDGGFVPAGTGTSFKIKPAPGFYVSDVIRDTTQSIGPVASYTFRSVVRNHTLQALFDSRMLNGSVATSARSYANVAFAIVPPAPADSVKSVLGALWPPDDTRWRLAHWDPASGSGGGYVFANTGLETVAPGLGYWLITSEPQTVQWQGKPLVAESYTLTLSGPAGWRQIGNPFRYPIADTALWVMSGKGCLLTDPANSLTDSLVYEAGYSTPVAHTLLLGRAYWLKKIVEGPVNLLFPGRTSAGPAAEPAMMKPEGALWALAVVVRQEGRETGPVLVGAARSSAVGGNMLRRFAAPGPPEAAARVTVAEGAAGERSEEYAWSFKPGAPELSWDLKLAGAEAPGEMALSLTPLDLPAGARVWLSDPREGWTRELSGGGEVSLAAFAGERTLRLTVVAASGVPPASVPGRSAWRAYPNPFVGTAGLVFSLAAPGNAAVEIFDVQGRSVRRFERAGLAAGEHVMVWDGLDEAGRAVRPGVYLARYRSGEATGVVRLVRVE